MRRANKAKDKGEKTPFFQIVNSKNLEVLKIGIEMNG